MRRNVSNHLLFSPASITISSSQSAVLLVGEFQFLIYIALVSQVEAQWEASFSIYTQICLKIKKTCALPNATQTPRIFERNCFRVWKHRGWGTNTPVSLYSSFAVVCGFLEHGGVHVYTELRRSGAWPEI